MYLCTRIVIKIDRVEPKTPPIDAAGVSDYVPEKANLPSIHYDVFFANFQNYKQQINYNLDHVK